MTDPEKNHSSERRDGLDPTSLSDELADAIAIERMLRHGQAELDQRTEELGDGVITAAQMAETEASVPDLIIELDGETYSSEELRVVNRHERFILAALPMLDTRRVVVRGQFIELGFYADGSEKTTIGNAFDRATHQLSGKLETASGQTLFARTGKGANVGYWIPRPFRVDGQEVSATEDPPLHNTFRPNSLPHPRPKFAVELTGEGFDKAELVLESRNEIDLLNVLPRLDGKALTSRLAAIMGFSPLGSRNAQDMAFKRGKPVLTKLNNAAGRELIKRAGGGSSTHYLIMESFGLNSEEVRTTDVEAIDLSLEAEAPEPGLTLEVNGETFTTTELGITHPHRLFILEALAKLDTRGLLSRRQFIELGFYADAASTVALTHAFERAVYGLYDGIESRTEETLFARTGVSGRTKYYVNQPFTLEGQVIQATEIPGLQNTFVRKAELPPNPDFVMQIAGESFGDKELVLNTYNQKFMLGLLQRLQGEPLTLRLALEYGFHSQGDYNTRKAAFGRAIRGLMVGLNKTTERELLINSGSGVNAHYRVTEQFMLNGQEVIATKSELLQAFTGTNTGRKSSGPRESSKQLSESGARPSPSHDCLRPDQIHPLHIVLANLTERDPEEILEADDGTKKALAVAMDKDDIAFNYTLATILSLRTGVLTNKHAKLPRFVRQGEESMRLSDLIENRVPAFRGLDVASVSAILGITPSTILATELTFLKKVQQESPTLAGVRSLMNRVEQQLSAIKS